MLFRSDAAHHGTNEKIGFAAAEARMPGFIAESSDDGLNKEAGQWTGQIQPGDLIGLGAQKIINGIDRALLQSKAVLYTEESDIHVDDLPEAQIGFFQCHGSLVEKMPDNSGFQREINFFGADLPGDCNRFCLQTFAVFNPRTK